MSTEPNERATGAWIFVSHSHRDLEKVRQIRNELERRGHNPLLFFLKCMDDDDARLPELIRDEIKAREWFILCDSPHAKDSGWVQQEVELIKAMEGKVFETVDLSKDLQTELHKLVRLSKRASVFLAYAQQDEETAERVRRALLRHDYRVWSDELVAPGDAWHPAINSAIDDAVSAGFVLVLLSPAAFESRKCRWEFDYAFNRWMQSPKSNIIPVIVAPFPDEAVPWSWSDQMEFQCIQRFDLTTGSFDERVEELIRNLKTREME